MFLFLLLYADDIVIFADNENVLQKGLEIYMIIVVVGNLRLTQIRLKYCFLGEEEFYKKRKLNVTFFRKVITQWWERRIN